MTCPCQVSCPCDQQEPDILPCEEPDSDDEEEDVCAGYDDQFEDEWEPPPFLPCEDRNASYAPSHWNSTLEESDDPVRPLDSDNPQRMQIEQIEQAIVEAAKRGRGDDVGDNGRSKLQAALVDVIIGGDDNMNGSYSTVGSL